MKINRTGSYHSNWPSVIYCVKDKPADVSMNQCFRPMKISLVWNSVSHTNLLKEISG